MNGGAGRSGLSEQMTFILAADGRDEDVTAAFARYKQYLQASRDRFPPAAYALATSDWYFDFTDHRCPHDAWVERLDLTEAPAAKGNGQRSISLCLRLLGAYHDGHIEFRYPDVRSYALTFEPSGGGHRDWRYDELRVSDEGNVLHEIEWWHADKIGHWLIEAADLEFRWLPKSEPPA
jgi:hypothetical protein